MNDLKKLADGDVDYNKVIRKYALFYAQEKNWQVFPLHSPIINGEDVKCSCGKDDCTNIGKHPKWDKDLLPSGLYSATTDVDLIKEWFKKWPDANIAIRTGKESNLIVLDADKTKGKRVLLSQPKLPYTAVAVSGRGYHYCFLHPQNDLFIKTMVAVLPGLDSRADLGYICAAPSLHEKGYRYEWLQDIQLAKAPDWWLEMVEKPQEFQLEETEIKVNVDFHGTGVHPYAQAVMSRELTRVYSLKGTEGSRNKTLNKCAFNVYRYVPCGAIDEATVTEEFTSAGLAIGLPLSEVNTCLNQAKKGGYKKFREVGTYDN